MDGKLEVFLLEQMLVMRTLGSSFDKGFFIRIPYSGVIPKDTKSFFMRKLKPIQGDGGVRVSVPGRIYEVISDKSIFNLTKNWPTIWR